MPEFRRLRSVWLLLAVGVLAIVAVLAIAIPPLVSGLARQPTGLVYAYDGVSHGAPALSGQFGTLPSTDPMGSVSSTAGDRVSSALFVTVVGAEARAAADSGIAITASDGTDVTGFTGHGIQRAIGDNAGRAGTRPQAILDTLRSPTKITQGVDNLGRPYKVYTGSNARVVINPDTGQVVSVNPMSGAGASR